MWRFLFSPMGRISRSDIWLKYFLPYLVISILAGLLDGFLIAGMMLGSGEVDEDAAANAIQPFGAIVGLFYLWPSIAVHIKRFHDLGMTGWWMLLYMVALCVLAAFMVVGLGPEEFQLLTEGGETNFEEAEPLFWIGVFGLIATFLIFFVMLYILPGQRGSNKYGDDPRAFQ